MDAMIPGGHSDLPDLKNPPMHPLRHTKQSRFNILSSVSDPDSGGLLDSDPDTDSESGSGSRGLKKRSKMLNNYDIILLFSDFYNILSFN